MIVIEHGCILSYTFSEIAVAQAFYNDVKRDITSNKHDVIYDPEVSKVTVYVRVTMDPLKSVKEYVEVIDTLVSELNKQAIIAEVRENNESKWRYN